MAVACVMAEPASLAGNLLRCRIKAKLSQRELATAAGVSVASVRNIEQGVLVDPRIGMLKAIAGALGVAIGVLLSDTPVEPPPIKRVRKPRKRPGDEASSP